MKIRLIAATALLTVGAAALVHAQPYMDPQPRTGAPRLADAARADARDARYAAPPAGGAGAGPSLRDEAPADRPAYRPRPATRPFAEAGPRGADAPPPADRREPAYDAADAPPPESRPYPAPRRAASYARPSYDRPAYDRPGYDRPAAYDEPRRMDRPAGYRSARFGDGGGSTWRTGRNEHAFAATIGGCRISGFAGPGGYKLDRSC